MAGRRTMVALVLGVMASTALLSGCAEQEKTTGPFTPTASAQSPGWISGERAVSIAIDRFGGIFESVTERPSKGQQSWQVALTGTDRGDLVVYVAMSDGTILDTRPL